MHEVLAFERLSSIEAMRDNDTALMQRVCPGITITCFLAHHSFVLSAVDSFYEVLPDRISESPASRIAMVEHR